MSAPARYLRFLSLATVALLALVATINLLVDPYGLFRVVRIDGFNAIKSQAGQRAVVFKRQGAERMRPNTLVLGNSRAEIGFDPQSPAWPASMQPVFNLALPGAGVDAALNEFTRVLEYTTPKVAVVGLDFLDFRVDPAAQADSTPPNADPMLWLRERLSALVTVGALADSLATLKAQHDPYATSLTDAGFNPMRDYVAIARREGYYTMFRQRNQENAGSYVRGPRGIYLADGRPAPEFRAVERMIDIAAGSAIQLKFVIYPVHAQTLVLFHQAGLWPAFEAWKRELVKRVAGAPAGASVELWDFSGFAPYADEPVPPPGDTRTEMRWYWEAGHFKKSLGEVMLATMFAAPGNQTRWGHRLTSGDLEDHLQRQRAARESFEASRAAETSELAGIINSATSTAGRRR
jgi:hypothetical protein